MGMPFVRQPRHAIGVDFGASSLKALQLASDHTVASAAAIPTPPEIAHDPAARLRWQFDQLPALLKQGRFSGKRAVCAISASRTIVEHVALTKTPGVPTADLLSEKLRAATGLEPNTLVVRHEEVGEVTRNGAKATETLIFAIPRAVVREHMRALKKVGLDTVGVHCEHAALARAVRTCEDPAENTSTLFLDLGASGVRAVVTCRGRYVASRTIHADLAAAATPQQLGATGTDAASVTVPAAASAMASHQLADTAEELGQLVRYCAAVRPADPIKSVVFTGGLSCNDVLSADLARRLRLPASAADPLSGYAWAKKPGAGAPGADDPKPGWAVPLGLCLAPTDL